MVKLTHAGRHEALSPPTQSAVEANAEYREGNPLIALRFYETRIANTAQIALVSRSGRHASQVP